MVLEADELTTAQKQSIARQVGLSETAFISRSTRATLKVEFFTPTRQIAHCGHATVAGPLGCWLRDVLGVKAATYRISQGRHRPNPSPSLLSVEVQARDDSRSAARVGGEALHIRTIEIEA